MLQQITVYLTSGILGIMIFFSFIVAPVTFKSLNEENARIFIRKIFPYYYNFNLAICLILVLFFVIFKSFNTEFFLILTITFLFGISNYVLMPLINSFRDEKKEKKFKISHFLSVFINFLQIILLIITLLKY